MKQKLFLMSILPIQLLSMDMDVTKTLSMDDMEIFTPENKPKSAVSMNAGEHLTKKINSRLIEIDLSNTDLSQDLFSQDFPHLVSLNLSACSLTDNHLKYLNTSSLTALQILKLSNNNINLLQSSVTRIFTDLQQLRLLDLSHNKIKFVSNKFLLPRLQELNLEHNEISELRKEITNATTLTSLKLSHNKLFDLPFGLHKLSQLRELTLEGNRLTAFQRALAQAKLHPDCIISGERHPNERNWNLRKYNDIAWSHAFKGEFKKAHKAFEQCAIETAGTKFELYAVFFLLAQQYTQGGLLVGQPNPRLAKVYQEKLADYEAQENLEYQQQRQGKIVRMENFKFESPETTMDRDRKQVLQKCRDVEAVLRGRQIFSWYPEALKIVSEHRKYSRIETPQRTLEAMYDLAEEHKPYQRKCACDVAQWNRLLHTGWQELIADELKKEIPDTEACMNALCAVKRNDVSCSLVTTPLPLSNVKLLNMLYEWAIKCNQQKLLKEVYDKNFIFDSYKDTTDPEIITLLKTTASNWAKIDRAQTLQCLSSLTRYPLIKEIFETL